MKKMWKIWTMTPTTQTEESFGSCELKTRIFAEKCRSKMSVDWHFNALKFPDSMKLIGKINLGNTHFGESISHSCTYLFWPCSKSPLLNLLEGQMKFLRSRSLCWFQWLHHPVWERWLVCLKFKHLLNISHTPTGM